MGLRPRSRCASWCAWPASTAPTPLLDITHAHIDSTIYIGDATLEFAERLATLGARVAVPTSLNVSGLDEHGWKAWPVSSGLGVEGPSPDGGVSVDGRRSDVDVRALSDPRAPGLRPADCVGRIERDRVRQLRHWRAHRALSRSVRHLLRHHRPCAGRGPAPHRASRRRHPDSPRRRAACRSRKTRRSTRCSGPFSARSPPIASRSSTGCASARRTIA